MKLTVKAAVVGAVLATTAVLAPPATASTDPKDGAVIRCSEGKFCLFDGHNFTGDVLQLDRKETYFIGWEWNDRASSVWNRTNGQVCIHTDSDLRGYYFDIPAGAQQELLFLYDNAVSSLEVGGCSGA
ncbi:peptidase inhibitor family I36 protein [Streptomyces sp. NPDC126497]|uniref:peptidase inhibitor family I36 protein n=1 Tax=Streptomyces sp. NPDC126497 TaxID=3155313 RepID=UPI00331AC49D